MIQELLELFQLDDSPDYSSCEEEEAHLVMVVQQSQPQDNPTAVRRKRKTMRFKGFVGKTEILILLDSSSAGTFITPETAASIQQSEQSCDPLQFVTADVSPMLSTTFIPQLHWCIQGHSFTYDARVLPLKGFDMILGADWLEDHSPMWLHWKKKIMRIPHQGRRIQLRGLQEDTSRCFKVSPHKLKGLLKQQAVTHCVKIKKLAEPETDTGSDLILTDPIALVSEQLSLPASIPSGIQSVIQQYSHLFQEPSTLPPSREFDHSIPLMPEAQPVNVRPYKYAPHQKTEIEKQVDDMLSKGLIQKSVSSFASPVLLVRKKSGSWRFWVDYRQLNTITVKDKHSMPVVDELLDELHGS